jgi:hypothetical protein
MGNVTDSDKTSPPRLEKKSLSIGAFDELRSIAFATQKADKVVTLEDKLERPLETVRLRKPHRRTGRPIGRPRGSRDRVQRRLPHPRSTTAVETIRRTDNLGKRAMLDDLRIRNEQFSRSLVRVEPRDHGLEEMTEFKLPRVQKESVSGRPRGGCGRPRSTTAVETRGRKRSTTWTGKLGAFLNEYTPNRLAGELDLDPMKIYRWARGNYCPQVRTAIAVVEVARSAGVDLSLEDIYAPYFTHMRARDDYQEPSPKMAVAAVEIARAAGANLNLEDVYKKEFSRIRYRIRNSLPPL